MDDLKRILGFDPQRLAADADRLFGGIREVYEADAGAVASAASEDGRLRVEYSAAEGVRALDIDPRAMRMPAADLAGTLLALIRRARAEAEESGRARAAELLAADGSVFGERERAQIGDRLRNATDVLQEDLRGADQLLATLRASLDRR